MEFKILLTLRSELNFVVSDVEQHLQLRQGREGSLRIKRALSL